MPVPIRGRPPVGTSSKAARSMLALPRKASTRNSICEVLVLPLHSEDIRRRQRGEPMAEVSRTLASISRRALQSGGEGRCRCRRRPERGSWVLGQTSRSPMAEHARRNMCEVRLSRARSGRRRAQPAPSQARRVPERLVLGLADPRAPRGDSVTVSESTCRRNDYLVTVHAAPNKAVDCRCGDALR